MLVKRRIESFQTALLEDFAGPILDLSRTFHMTDTLRKTAAAPHCGLDCLPFSIPQDAVFVLEGHPVPVQVSPEPRTLELVRLETLSVFSSAVLPGPS